MNKAIEIILFNKYLIRTDKFQYILSVLRNNKKPTIPIIKRTIKGVEGDFKDYSNFTDETYHSRFEHVLFKIKEYEIFNSGANSLEELIVILKQIDKSIEFIKNKFA